MIKTRRSMRYAVITAALLGAGGLASALPAQGSVAAPGQHKAATRPDTAALTRGALTRPLAADLTRSGFQVSPGYPMLYPLSGCTNYTYPIVKNCFGNNPAAPYVVPVVKAWPNEHVGPTNPNVFGQVRPGYTPVYRLAPRDALVIYGTMPPPGKYMGLQTWEWSKDGHWKPGDYRKWARDPRRPVPMQYLFDTVPPDNPRAGRVITFSSLGDIVNNVVMQRQSGYPFGKKRYFIVTPSATTDQAVRHVLRAQGVPGGDIFTEQIPSRDSSGSIGPLGMGAKAIDFTTLFRYAVPASTDAANAWRSQLPLTVLRVRVPASLGPVRRYGRLTYARRTAHSEAHLAGDRQNLINAVCARVSSITHLHGRDCTQPPPASSFMPDLFDGLGWTGPYCRSISMDCLGDQQDAAYYGSKPLPLDSGQVYAVVETLATETRNATYVGLGVNDASMLAGVANVFDTTLKGSADRYAATVNNAGKFFVHYYTRNCDAPALKRLVGDRPQDCTSITKDMVPLAGNTTAPGDPALHGMFMLSLRDYIVPGTERGPLSTKLLSPVVLSFEPCPKMHTRRPGGSPGR